MANDYLVKQTLKMIHEIVVKLINPDFRLPNGGEPKRIINKVFARLEKDYGVLNLQRIVDYVVCAAYPYKSRGNQWSLKQMFGPKSFERFDTDKIRVWYENQWLATAELNRDILLEYIVDKKAHPKAKYIYNSSEDGTKFRLLNSKVGYIMCQMLTLGWSPLSPACDACKFVEKCKRETQTKFPEIYRLRNEVCQLTTE